MPKVKNAKLWERDPNDWYPEPPWCADSLFAAETFTGPLLDPCAGRGHIAVSAAAAGYEIEASDLIERHVEGVTGGRHYGLALMTSAARTIVTNPPFNQARELIGIALSMGFDVAAFLQLRFIGSAGRADWFDDTPLASVGVLTPRPSCPPGSVWAAGGSKLPTGATSDFAWFIWRQSHKGPPVLKWMRKL